jgi:hypothetical protein
MVRRSRSSQVPSSISCWTTMLSGGEHHRCRFRAWVLVNQAGNFNREVAEQEQLRLAH